MITILPAAIEHVYALSERLRDEDRHEIESAGLDPRRCLRDSFKNALHRRTAFVDGEIAAMWGLGGEFVSHVGSPWLLTTKAVERVPVSFVKIGRSELADMLSLRNRLENYVAASYGRAVRFLNVMGFSIDPPKPFGPRQELFRRFWIGTERQPSRLH